MLAYTIRRLLRMIPTLIVISILSFVIIQLPPGDFFDSLQAQLAESDSKADQEAFTALREQYHLDQPLWKQYLYWVGGCIQGDFGYSFEWRRPVSELIAERLGLTFIMSFGSLLFMWFLAIPIGIYSARNRLSPGDYLLTFLAFIGLCVPGFVIALIAMYVSVFWFGGSAGGLFSPEYLYAPWSLARIWDLLQHLWVPVLVIGAAGTATMMRLMRTSMLDVLGEPYITTARAKGLAERWVIYKYAVRVAINPMISILGMQIPQLVSGSIIVAIVLGLPTTGPLFYRALETQDMYLAGTFLMLLAVLLLLGNLLADILLAWADPRIRLD
ncbi:MAG TPA: ABC transporter permease [Candidatus Latescibacteria bacterium]|nr:ABC transporter permease [Gemmatimonadota bacterium]HCR16489.1 ABC transporter permease [Candidatus Latescibacterota bacterium]